MKGYHFNPRFLGAWLGLLLTMSAVFGANISPPEYRTDQILIRPKAGIRPDTLAAFHAAHAATVARTFAAAGLQVVTVPAGATVPGLITEYQAGGLVDFAEPDYLVHEAATLPNDPKFVDGTLWGLYNYGQSGGTPSADIDATEGWDVLTSASNIVVALLDSGVRSTHQDLAANIWVNPLDGGHGFDYFTGTNNPADGTGHGTLVAGVLGAVGNNGIGVTGVAWRIQMMVCRCLDNTGIGSDSSVIACMEYARTNGARIMNASFSSTNFSLAVSNEIILLQSSNIILVCAAGNGNPGVNVDLYPTFPACFKIDNVISVAYTTRNDVLGNLSNYGATNVLLAAPGDQIYSTFSTGDNAYYPPTGLAVNIAGTSFSAPMVSGALALLLARFPGENYQQTIHRLLAAADPLPSLVGKCSTASRLNLKKALNPDIHLAPMSPPNAGAFQLRLTAWQNRQCVIQASTNLAAWLPVYTNTTSTNGIFEYTNPAATPQQFFRRWARHEAGNGGAELSFDGTRISG